MLKYNIQQLEEMLFFLCEEDLKFHIKFGYYNTKIKSSNFSPLPCYKITIVCIEWEYNHLTKLQLDTIEHGFSIIDDRLKIISESIKDNTVPGIVRMTLIDA